MWNSVNFMNNAELRNVMDSNKLDAKWQAGQYYWHGSKLTLVPFFDLLLRYSSANLSVELRSAVFQPI